MFQLVEDSQLEGTRITTDGYMTANVRCARTGIQEYAGFEFGLDQDIVRVYRPESEVFKEVSLNSFAGKPVTDDHPDEMVNAENWKDHSVGSIGNEVLRDGQFIRVPITLMDADVINKIQNGKREISMGYTMNLDFTSGVTDSGEEFDAVQRDLKMNHLAIVKKGRAGPSVRVGDSWEPIPKKPLKENKMTLVTKVVDGFSVETTQAGVEAIDKLNDKLAAAIGDAEAAETLHQETLDQKQATHDAAIADKDRELAAKDAEIAELKEQVLDAQAIDAKVAERSALIGKASKLIKDSKFEFTGKPDMQIMKAAVDAVNGEGFSADKSDTYVEAAFDLAKVPEGTGDDVRDALINREPSTQTTDNGQSEYNKKIQDAWMGEAK